MKNSLLSQFLNVKTLPQARLIIDPPTRGAANMAIDEAILANARGMGIPTLRFYQWAQPTLSLGYFQAHESRQKHDASQSCDWVRRNSGGGAILHHHELTYSITFPEGHETLRSKECYRLFHEVLIECLGVQGVTAQFCGEGMPEREGEFLCFQRRSPDDVLLNGTDKICGSAQRKRYGSIGQHGSIILETSSYAPEIKGIFDIANRRFGLDWLQDQMVKTLEKRLNIDFELSSLTAEESLSKKQLENDKYSSKNWNLRR